jgi:hypothetical protein
MRTRGGGCYPRTGELIFISVTNGSQGMRVSIRLNCSL